MNRNWTLKAVYAACMLAGGLLAGLPAYAQITGSGTVLPPVNASAVISVPVPNVTPVYTASTMPPASTDDTTKFDAWVTANAGVNIYPATHILPAPGQSVFVLYRFSVTDSDGANDIQPSEAQLLKPDGSVHTPYAPAKPLGTSSALTKEYYVGFELRYYDPPATQATVYKVTIKVADVAGVQAGTTVDNLASPKLFHYGDIVSLRPLAASINFGNLQVNGKSSGVAVTLANEGNIRADSTLSATDLAKGADKIAASKIWYGPTASAAGTNFPSTGAAAKRDVGFNLDPLGSRVVYLAVEVPSGTPAGVYTTSITFNGVNGSTDVCSSDCANVNWSG